MNVLSEIIAKKRERVEEAKRAVPLERLRSEALAKRERAASHALRRALQSEGINVIAEFKRRSPSKGVIRADADLASIVQSYKAGGAVALSVLTEEDYFDGSLADLRTTKATVDLPVLRKDFLFDEYQVFEAAAAGADAILLIVSVLDDDQLESLRSLAEELGMVGDNHATVGSFRLGLEIARLQDPSVKPHPRHERIAIRHIGPELLEQQNNVKSG